MNWDRLMENYHGPLESYTEDFHPPEDIAIIKRGLVIHRTKELGYGVKGPEVWTVTAAGAMTTPALFFPTRQAADRYIEQNAGSEGSYVGATGSPEEADGPLGRALFGFGYFGAGEPEQYRIERHELETDHDGEHVWILRAATYNRVEWAVNVFATRSEAEQALRVQKTPFRTGRSLEAGVSPKAKSSGKTATPRKKSMFHSRLRKFSSVRGGRFGTWTSRTQTLSHLSL